jgi:serine/threonine protein kinase
MSIAELIKDFSRMNTIRPLGRGTSGSVTLVEDPSTGQLIALKTFNLQEGGDLEVSDVFFREIDSLVHLTHPCVVPIVGYFLARRDSPPQIATRFAENGSLRDALDKRRRGSLPTFLDATGIAIIVTGIVLGMRFVHSRNAIHRDLKPANILIDKQGRPQIADLGSIRFCDLGLTLTSQVGTPLYMAPEMYEGAGYTGAIDVYAFGLILFEILVGVPVFAPTNPANLMAKVLGGERPSLPESMHPTVRTIIKRCWAVDPELRDDFDMIFYLLARLSFKITDAVDSKRVAHFVAEVGAPSRTFLPADPLAGIIAYLTERCGGNVHEKGAVRVTCSVPADHPDFGVKNIVDLNAETVFGTDYRFADEDIAHEPNNWVCYDFGERRVIPTHYTLRSPDSEILRDAAIRSWLVATSLDGTQWTEIDRRENTRDLIARGAIKTYLVPGTEKVRFIRLMNIGRNQLETDAVFLSAFEIFGTLFE